MWPWAAVLVQPRSLRIDGWKAVIELAVSSAPMYVRTLSSMIHPPDQGLLVVAQAGNLKVRADCSPYPDLPVYYHRKDATERYLVMTYVSSIFFETA